MRRYAGAALVAAICFGVTYGSPILSRASNETFTGFVSHIGRVPGEFIINLIPNIVSATVFSIFLLAPTPHRLARTQSEREI